MEGKRRSSTRQLLQNYTDKVSMAQTNCESWHKACIILYYNMYFIFIEFRDLIRFWLKQFFIFMGFNETQQLRSFDCHKYNLSTVSTVSCKFVTSNWWLMSYECLKLTNKIFTRVEAASIWNTHTGVCQHTWNFTKR